jgi:hypothetical protein
MIASLLDPRRFGERPFDFELDRESAQAKGLVAWWPLVGDTRDHSLYGNHGTAANGAVEAVTDLGGCYRFDGDNDKIDIPASSRYSTDTELSVSLWFRSTGAPSSSGDLLEDFTGTQIFRIFLDAGRPRRRHRDSGGTYADNTYGSINEFHDSTWHLLVETLSRVTDVEKLYIDGADTGDDTSLAAWTGTFGPDSAITIGRVAASHEGEIADVRIYDHALSAGIVHEIFSPATRCDLYAPRSRPTSIVVEAGAPTAVMAGTYYRTLLQGAA